MKIATEKNIRKSFSDVRKDISELKDRIANMDKELGILMGKKIEGKKNLPVIDFGMIRNVHKSRAYAFLKGLIDSGIKITHKEEHLKNLEEEF